jgi:hypothetical protein
LERVDSLRGVNITLKRNILIKSIQLINFNNEIEEYLVDKIAARRDKSAGRLKRSLGYCAHR